MDYYNWIYIGLDELTQGTYMKKDTYRQVEETKYNLVLTYTWDFMRRGYLILRI